MRPTLKQELEFAVWKITGASLKFSEYTIPYVSQEIARRTGEDPAVVSLRLIQEIKQIVNDDVDRQLKRCRPCVERT